MLIIGSRGFLGTYAARAAAGDFHIIEGNRTISGQLPEVQIDVKDEESVRAAFEVARPDVVLLFAAYSDIDYCERFPEEARAVNLHGAERVAAACMRSRARLVFISTGAVFDGTQHGYTEESPTSPVSVYGQTKAEAEILVRELVRDALIVRIALAIGFAARPGSPGFLDNLAKRWEAGESVAMPVFESRNPIDAVTCSRFVLELVKAQARGIFHIGATESVTRYELGLKLASRMGYAGRVLPQLESVPGRAPRGPDHYLLTDKLRSACAIPIPSCDEVIERCFHGAA